MRWKIGKRTEPDLISHLLQLRQVTDKKKFLHPLHPSSLTIEEVGLEKKALGTGLNLIQQAIKQKETIVVYGDYDVDGVAGTAIVWEILHSLGGNIFPYIPHRKNEGYGFSTRGIETIMEKYNPRLIISVDHGITAEEEVAYLAKEGVDVIVTDHHQPPTQKQISSLLPGAKAVIHTSSLSGAGIAWYLASCLSQREDDEHLGLAAFGTIADIVPLVGPNRQITHYGLKALTNTQRVGLCALKKEANIANAKIESYHIGYILGPRINAAGRIEHALDALRLLCTNDRIAADRLAQKLGSMNRERQRLLKEQLNYSLENLKQIGALPPLLILSDEVYEEGIIGLIAGKLAERYYRPTIVISQDPEGTSRASARSIPGVNIIEMVREVKELLLGVGGHPMAAGFSLQTESIPVVAEELLQIARDKIAQEQLERTLEIDAQMNLSEITRDLHGQLEQFAPFGTGNPEPLFCTRVVFLSGARTVGAEGKHLKFKVGELEAIAFNRGYLLEKLNLAEPVDIAYTLSLNHWNEEEILQLKIRDIKQSH